MKSVLLSITLLHLVAISQMSYEKAIKKLNIPNENVIYTNEAVLLFPRGFIYDLSNLDSLFYFGCISSDQKDYVNYFEQSSTSIKSPVGNTLLRGAGGTTDTIFFESLNDKRTHLFYKDNSNRRIELSDKPSI